MGASPRVASTATWEAAMPSGTAMGESASAASAETRAEVVAGKAVEVGGRVSATWRRWP